MFPDVTLPLRNKWPHVARRHMEVWRHRLQRRGISLLRLFWVAVGNRDCFGPAVVHSHLSPSFHDPKPTWLSTKLLIKLHEASDESLKSRIVIISEASSQTCVIWRFDFITGVEQLRR